MNSEKKPPDPSKEVDQKKWLAWFGIEGRKWAKENSKKKKK